MSISLQPLTFGTVSATTSAAALNGGTSLPCAGVCVQCDPGASADVLVGDGASQPLRLKPGQSLAMEITDAALLFVKSASGTQTVNWVAGPRDLRIFGTGLTGGGGGSPAAAVTIADGADTTFGAQADAAAAGDSSTASYVSLFKRLLARVTTLIGLLPAALTGSGNLKAAIVESTATVVVDTELPAAAALGEGMSNPTAPGVAAFGCTWNGATWDRLRSPAGDGAPVTGLVSAAVMGFNGSGYDRARVDNTAALRVSLFGKQAANGDTALALDSSGRPTVNVNGTVTVDTELPAAAALADAAANPTTPMDGACLLAYNGASWDRLRYPNKRLDLSAVSVTSVATLLTPTSGKKFRLFGGCISLSAAASLLFEDNAGGATVFRTPALLAATPYNFDMSQGFLSAVANNVLKGTSSAAATVTGTLFYGEE